MTADFQKIMEETAGQNLKSFFQQWIFTKGYPEIKWSWSYKKGGIHIVLEQVQDHQIFSFPLEIEITKNGKSTISTVQVNQKKSSFEIDIDSRPESVHLDPNFWLLFKEK